MLLENKNNLKELSTTGKSVYKDDKFFKAIVKSLTPSIIYASNEKLLDSFSECLVNYSPISINIIDFWDKTPEEGSYIIPQPNNPEQYDNFITQVDQDYMTVLDPVLHEEFHVPENDEFQSNYIPSVDYGFHIGSTIDLKDQLAYIFMHNVYSVTEIAKRSTNLKSRVQDILKRLNLETTLMNNVNNLFTEDRYIINGEWVTKKGTYAALTYSAHQAIDSEVQPYRQNTPFVFDIKDIVPFAYQVEGSVFPAIFDYFIVPLSHPIGYTYDYRMLCPVQGDYDYDNSGFDKGFIDFVLSRQIESLNTLKVNCLCDSNYEPCCNTFPDGSTGAPKFESEFEEFTCLNYSGGQYARWFVISCTDGSEIIWDEIDQDNVLLKKSNGIIQSHQTEYPNYQGWVFHKWEFTNGNFLIKFYREADAYYSENLVIEYNQGGAVHSRWNNGWQTNIQQLGYTSRFESTLYDEIEITQGTDELLPFGFEDNPDVTEALFLDGEGPNPAFVVPTWWVYNPMDWSNINCDNQPVIINAGFANYGESVLCAPFGFEDDPDVTMQYFLDGNGPNPGLIIPPGYVQDPWNPNHGFDDSSIILPCEIDPDYLLDPLNIAGFFYNHKLSEPCLPKNATIGIKAVDLPSNFYAIINPINNSIFGYQDNPEITLINYLNNTGPNPDDVIPLGYTWDSLDQNGALANQGGTDPLNKSGTLN